MIRALGPASEPRQRARLTKRWRSPPCAPACAATPFREMHLHGLEIFLGQGVHGALEARERGGVIVMIDALRASATMIAALEMRHGGDQAGRERRGVRGRGYRRRARRPQAAQLPPQQQPDSSSCATTTRARPWSSLRPTAPSACSARPGRRASCSSARAINRRAVAGAAGRLARKPRRADHPAHGGAQQPVRRSRTRSPPARSRARCRKRGCTASCRRPRRSKPISAPAIQAAT